MRNEAAGFYKKMGSLEIGILATFWNDVLDNLNRTSKYLQSSRMQLNTAIASLRSLRAYIHKTRDMFEKYEKLGAELTGINEYKNERVRQPSVRQNPLDYGKSSGVSFTPSESFKINQFLPVIDTFLAALDQRTAAYEEIELRFGFLSRFHTVNDEEISKRAKFLVSIYSEDLDDTLEGELIQFKEFCAELLDFDPEKSDVSREQAMYSLIMNKDVDVKESFPNVEMLLRIYLTLMVSNCTGERSFSKLKLIKNYLRTSMNQNRLNCLTIMALERDILREVPVDDIIQKFAEQKARKVFI